MEKKGGGLIKEYTTTHYYSNDDEYIKEINWEKGPLVNLGSIKINDSPEQNALSIILAQTDLTKFPDDAEIQDKSKTYDQELVPESRNYERTSKLRDDTQKELFKKYFLGENPEPLKEWVEKDFEE